MKAAAFVQNISVSYTCKNRILTKTLFHFNKFCFYYCHKARISTCVYETTQKVFWQVNEALMYNKNIKEVSLNARIEIKIRLFSPNT